MRHAWREKTGHLHQRKCPASATTRRGMFDKRIGGHAAQHVLYAAAQCLLVTLWRTFTQMSSRVAKRATGVTASAFASARAVPCYVMLSRANDIER